MEFYWAEKTVRPKPKLLTIGRNAPTKGVISF